MAQLMNIFTQAIRIPLSTALVRPAVYAKIHNPDNDVLRLVHQRHTADNPRVCKYLHGSRLDAQKFGYAQISTDEITEAGYYLRDKNGRTQLLNVVNDLKGSRFIFRKMCLGIKTKHDDNFVPESIGNNIVACRSEYCTYLLVAPKRFRFSTHQLMLQYIEENPSACDAYLLTGNIDTMRAATENYNHRGHLALCDHGRWRLSYASNHLQYVPDVVNSVILGIVKHSTHKLRINIGGKESTLKGNFTVNEEMLNKVTLITHVSPNRLYSKTPDLLGQLTRLHVINAC